VPTTIAVKRLADWQRMKALVLDRVSSPITRRVYNMALNELMEWIYHAGSEVVEVKGSHAVYVSQPEAVADLIERAANGQSRSGKYTRESHA